MFTVFLQCPYISGRGAFLALLNIERYALTLLQRLEALGLNRAVMYENVFAAIHFDEPKAFSVVKPFNGTFCHNLYPPFSNFSKSDHHRGKNKKATIYLQGHGDRFSHFKNVSIQLAVSIYTGFYQMSRNKITDPIYTRDTAETVHVQVPKIFSLQDGVSQFLELQHAVKA